MKIVSWGINRRHWNRIYSCKIQQAIKEFIKSTKDGFTAKDVRHYIQKEHKILLPVTSIVKFMKNELLLSYKKGWVRPYRCDWKKLSFARLLYYARLGRLLNKNTLIVNVDETLLSNDIFNWMSWIPKGKNSEQFSVKYEGSASLITAVTSDGNYLATPFTKAIDYFAFKGFLLHLEGWIESQKLNKNSGVIIILDIRSFLRNSKTQDLMKQSKFTYMNIPQYYPILVPIELVFGKLKYLIKSEKKINWSN